MEPVQLTLKAARVVRVMAADPVRPRYQLDLMAATGMGSGTLYPILARLAAAGWLVKERENIDPVVEGRPRRMLYRLTAEAVPVARAQLAAIGEEFGGAL